MAAAERNVRDHSFRAEAADAESLQAERQPPPHPGACHGRHQESQQARQNAQ
jgi:hypothetical protein